MILVCLAILLVYEEGSPKVFLPAYVLLLLTLVGGIVSLAVIGRVRELERFVLWTVVGDVVLEVLLSYLTGGIYLVGFAFLFFGTVISATLLLSDRAGFVIASLASVALALITLAYWLAVNGTIGLPAVPAPLYQDIELRWGQVVANLVGFACALHAVAFLGSRFPYRISRVRILYDEVVERMREGLVAIDRSGTIVMVNAEACRLLNWGQPAGLLGKKYERVLRRREDKQVLQILARDEDTHSEIELTIRDRAPVAVEVITTVLKDSQGRVRGVVGIFRDLSLQRRLEAMETRLASLSGTEETALNIAHEIRTPLASIRGAVQELTRHTHTDDGDRRLAEIVRRESDRVDRILQEFLDFARMRPRVDQRFELWELVGEIAVLLRQRPEVGEVEIEWEDVEESYEISGDPDRIRQALLNLGANALDALDGRGRLRFSVAEVDLPERIQGPERKLSARRAVEIAIDDDGANPVPADDYQRVFLPFFTTKQGGQGLGLAIAQKIVRLHGGDISCGPGELGGTCFRLTIPLEGSGLRPETPPPHGTRKLTRPARLQRAVPSEEVNQ